MSIEGFMARNMPNAQTIENVSTDNQVPEQQKTI